MKAYAYSIRRLLVFLGQRGADVLPATETDLLEFRYWRTQAQPEPVGQATWERESAAINGLYEWLGWLLRRGWTRVSGAECAP